MRQLAVALQREGVRARHYRPARELGAPSPAFVAAVVSWGVVGALDVAQREWEARSGKLWRKWHQLSNEAKVGMVRMGRRLLGGAL